MFDPEKYGLTIEELPAWMRPTMPRTDWAWLGTLVLCLVAIFPLFNRSGLPPTLQAELETYRIVSVSDSLRAGDFYPRWSAEFNYGYGSPLFNYLAPLPHYLGGVHQVLTTNEAHTSLKFMIGLAILIAGMSTMSFVRRLWGPLAGVFAAMLFVFSPYLSLTGPYLLSDMGILWAVSLFPALLWALDRALMEGRGRDLILLSGISAALLLSDNSLSPLLFALAAGWMAWAWITHHPNTYWRVPLLGMLGGIGLSMFYLLPAHLEWEYVRWTDTDTYPMAIDPGNLFAVLTPIDQQAFNPPPTMHLGISLWVIAGIGSLVLLLEIGQHLYNRFWSKHSHQRTSIRFENRALWATLYFLPVLIVFIVLALSPGMAIWESGDGFEDLRPIDLLGVMTFLCVVISSQITVVFERYLHHISRRLIALSIILLTFIPSTATVFYAPDFLTVRDIRNQGAVAEQSGHTLSTLVDGLLLPDTVERLPELEEFTTAYYTERDKVDRRELPPNLQVAIREQRPTHNAFLIDSPVAQEIKLLTFHFPGWQATRNNDPIELKSDSPHGLIVVPLESGQNDVEVTFQNTIERQIAWGITIIALFCCISLGYWLERLRTEKPARSYMTPLTARIIRDRKWLVAVMVCITSLSALFIRLNPEYFTLDTDSGEVPPGVTAHARIVNGGIGFQGYELNTSTADPGDYLMLTTYWIANPDRPNLPDHQIRILITSTHTGDIVYDKSYRHISPWPSNQWIQTGYIVAPYPLPDDLSPGTYRVALEVGVCERKDLIPCTDAPARLITDLRNISRQIVIPQTITIK